MKEIQTNICISWSCSVRHKAQEHLRPKYQARSLGTLQTNSQIHWTTNGELTDTSNPAVTRLLRQFTEPATNIFVSTPDISPTIRLTDHNLHLIRLFYTA